MSTLFVNNLNTASGSTITVPTGKQIIGTDARTFKAPGMVIQISQAYARGAVTNSTTTLAGTGLDIDFTPSSTSSKVLIMASFDIDTSASSRQAYATLYRDSTRLDNITDAGSIGLTNLYDAGDRVISNSQIHFLDSPSSTSQLHYEVYFKTTGGSVQFCSQNCRGVITCMEIAQ